MEHSGNPNLAKYTINKLLTFIRRKKDKIRSNRKWWSGKTYRYRTQEIRIHYCEQVREWVAMIRVAQDEIDWRKENNLYKLKDLKQYWKGVKDGKH